MAKCRHRKVILACANYVVFTPDQEPFERDVIESSGIEEIIAESLYAHYCPICKVFQDIGNDGDVEEKQDDSHKST